ncbi:hypothetical protein SI65_03679 [Aspergillus cristatus]|uniref:Beta-glucuronidase C-terminal domain-containing protein n=1 Tax=Aspergillus cristatus TaxID=573508 RepID=A0A1E3BJS5_ASPCR|nr:hypothetical protein SI65_03679 [Aspergillus cristatus]
MLSVLAILTLTSIGQSAFTPLKDGYPVISNKTTLADVEQLAGGHAGTYPPAPTLDVDDRTSWAVLAFSSLSTIAFYNELIANITNHVPGYDVSPTMITDFESAIDYAIQLSYISIGHIPDMVQHTANNLGTGGANIIFNVAGWSSVYGQQNGWFWSLLGKSPSVQPVSTPAPRDFLYSLIYQTSVVPGSCPDASLPVQRYEPLILITENVKDALIKFEFINKAKIDAGSNHSMVYLNGNIAPLTVPFNVSSNHDDKVKITADFPHDKWNMDGLTLVSVVKGTGNFSFPIDVANATLFGPALIVYN